MARFIGFSLLIVQAVTACVARAADAPDTLLVRVLSPNGQVRIEFAPRRHDEAEAVPSYRVFFKEQSIILASRLGVLRKITFGHRKESGGKRMAKIMTIQETAKTHGHKASE